MNDILQPEVRSAPVCLEGMGWLGSVLAWELERRKVPFVWYDNDSTSVAWQASAGAILPIGEDRAGYNRWREWSRAGPPWGMGLGHIVERAALWTERPPFKPIPGVVYSMFDEKSPAAEVKFPEFGGLKRHTEASWHVNVRQFVTKTRERFADCRVESRPDGSPLLRSLGFNSRLLKYGWAWSAVVKLQVEKSVLRESGRNRPAFALAVGFKRFNAYPLAGEKELWIAGTSSLEQTGRPTEFDVKQRLRDWAEALVEVSGKMVACTEVVETRFGYSPCAGNHRRIHLKGEPAPGMPFAVTKTEDGVYELPPCGSRGVEMAPVVLDSFGHVAQEIFWRRS